MAYTQFAEYVERLFGIIDHIIEKPKAYNNINMHMTLPSRKNHLYRFSYVKVEDVVKYGVKEFSKSPLVEVNNSVPMDRFMTVYNNVKTNRYFLALKGKEENPDWDYHKMISIEERYTAFQCKLEFAKLGARKRAQWMEFVCFPDADAMATYLSEAEDTSLIIQDSDRPYSNGTLHEWR